MSAANGRWSSWLAFNLATVGAAVGLGSIWRFPYLAGTNGGSTFLLVFILACVAIATPLLVAEFIIGRRSPTEPAGSGGAGGGGVRSFAIVELDWRVGHGCLRAHHVELYRDRRMGGRLRGNAPPDRSWDCPGRQSPTISRVFWRARGRWVCGIVFLASCGWISAQLNRGIEIANKIRAPGLLILLLVLVGLRRHEGDVRGLALGFNPT